MFNNDRSVYRNQLAMGLFTHPDAVKIADINVHLQCVGYLLSYNWTGDAH